MRHFTVLTCSVFLFAGAWRATAATEAPGHPERAVPAERAVPGASKVSVQMTFLAPSGATLGQRRIDLTLGKTETVSIQQGDRTVSAETTVVRGAKEGCHRIDITLRDRTIDPTGHFNKTVWQSGSEPCGEDPLVLGPKRRLASSCRFSACNNHGIAAFLPRRVALCAPRLFPGRQNGSTVCAFWPGAAPAPGERFGRIR